MDFCGCGYTGPTQCRPDQAARRILKGRTSTVFPVPCRQAIYAATIPDAYAENLRVTGKRFPPQTRSIMPKIKEVDQFLQLNYHLKNHIAESHPEVCFAQLAGQPVMSKKNTSEGRADRIALLLPYLPSLCDRTVLDDGMRLRCAPDDILDALCLAVTTRLSAVGGAECIPEMPCTDDTGLLMQMIVPKKAISRA